MKEPTPLPKLILFMRHGHHLGGALTDEGEQKVRATAAHTAETLIEMGYDDAGVSIVYIETSTPETRHTAEVVQHVLADRWAKAAFTASANESARCAAIHSARKARSRVRGPQALGDAPAVNAFARYDAARAAVATAIEIIETRTERVVLVVANDPFLSWMIYRCGCSVSLERGEVAALQRRSHVPTWVRRRWSVSWAIMEGEGTAAQAVREKIRSKMDIAKVFGALGVALLTFLLQERIKGTASLQSRTPSLALVAISAGTALYFATLFTYDLLLMPTRFWMPRGHRRRSTWVSERPPSPDFWILYQNMIHAWTWLFVPACLLVATGLVLLALTPNSSTRDWSWAWVPGTIVIVAAWWWRSRPRLGATD